MSERKKNLQAFGNLSEAEISALAAGGIRSLETFIEAQSPSPYALKSKDITKGLLISVLDINLNGVDKLATARHYKVIDEPWVESTNPSEGDITYMVELKELKNPIEPDSIENYSTRTVRVPLADLGIASPNQPRQVNYAFYTIGYDQLDQEIQPFKP